MFYLLEAVNPTGRRSVLPLLITIFLCACVTPPVKHHIEIQREFDASKERVWAGLMDYFTTKNIPIKTLEKESGVVYAEMSTSGRDPEMNRIADCGTYPLETPRTSIVSFNVFVRERDLTVVTVNTRFNREWVYMAVIVRPCTSRGVIEKAVLNHIDQYLASNPA